MIAAELASANVAVGQLRRINAIYLQIICCSLIVGKRRLSCPGSLLAELCAAWFLLLSLYRLLSTSMLDRRRANRWSRLFTRPWCQRRQRRFGRLLMVLLMKNNVVIIFISVPAYSCRSLTVASKWSRSGNACKCLRRLCNSFMSALMPQFLL